MMLSEQDRALSVAAQAKPVDDILGGAPEPGAFSGVLGEIPRGAVRGLAAVQGVGASMLETATQPLYNAITSATGIPTDNPFGQLRRASDETVRAFTPDPLTVGTAGQIVGGVADITTKVAAGAALTAATGGTALPALLWGGAATAGISTGRTTYNEMLAKGVDPSTAVNAGFIDAVTTGGGALLPAGVGASGLGGFLAAGGVPLSRGVFLGANAAVGAGVNVATGVIQRGATQDALRAGGYETMARQYAPMDGSAMAADAILGGIFSTAGSAANLPALGAHTVDAALAARDAKHAGITTAPGIPSDPNAAAAHGRALDKALRDVWDGNAVDVGGTGVADQAFVFGRRDNTAVSEAAREYGMPAAQVQPSTRLADIPAPDRAALPYNAPELNEYAAHIEQQYGLPPGLINALKNAGERSNSNQVSPAGARGVMQFMPENLKKYGVTDPTDPVQMIDAAGRYLRDTARQYGGNVDAMIADYNGGPRQAREVLAGREPAAPETRDYLARVRQDLGRGTSWADQAPGGEGLIRSFPEDRARTARAIEQEIASAEQAHADLTARASSLADLGEVSRMSDELTGLQQQFDALSADTAARDRAKEIQATSTQVSYKEALSQAKQQIGQQLDDINARIGRVQDAISQNADAAQALQQLADLDARIADLRANRAAIEAPASVLTPTAAAVRGAVDSGPQRGTRAREAESEPPVPAGMTRLYHGSALHGRYDGPAWFTSDREYAANYRQGAELQYVDYPTDKVNAHLDPDGYGNTVDRGFTFAKELDSSETGPRRPVQSQAEAAPRREATADDIETRAGLALLDEQGDIKIQTVDESGQPMELSLRDALADANAELEYATPEAFDAAILCQLRGGA